MHNWLDYIQCARSLQTGKTGAVDMKEYESTQYYAPSSQAAQEDGTLSSLYQQVLLKLKQPQERLQ